MNEPKYSKFLIWSHLVNAARRLSERQIAPMYGLVLLLLFLSIIKWSSEAKSRWIYLKFPSLNLKGDFFHSHLSSFTLLISAMLGLPHLERRSGLLQLKIPILDFHLCDYGLTKLSLCTTNIVCNMVLHQLLGASCDTSLAP